MKDRWLLGIMALGLLLQAPLRAEETEGEGDTQPQATIGGFLNSVVNLPSQLTGVSMPGTDEPEATNETPPAETKPAETPAAETTAAETEGAGVGGALEKGIGSIFQGVGEVLQSTGVTGGAAKSETDADAPSPQPELSKVDLDHGAGAASPSVETAPRHGNERRAYGDIRSRFIKLVLALRYGEAAELLLAADVDHRDVQRGDVWLVCETWVNVRHFRKLDSCITSFERQIREDDATEVTAGTNISFRYNIHFGQFQLLRWKALRALEFGDLDKVIQYGNAARAITDNNKVALASDSVMGFLQAPADLLNDAIDLGGNKNENYMNKNMAYDSYGVLAIAHARKGNTAEYRRNLNDLLSLVSDRYSAEYKIRYWLVLAYLTAGDYEAALRETQLREKDFLDTFNKAVVDLNPLVGIIGAVMGTDMSSYERHGLLEYQYIKAHSLYKLGRRDEARKVYDTLLGTEGVAGQGSIYFRLLFDRAVMAEGDGQADLALDLYARAIDVIEQQRSTIATESGKLGFTGGHQKIYERMIRLLLLQSKYARAFEYVERAKARALVDMLASRQNFSGGKTGAQASGYVQQLAQLDADQEMMVGKPAKGGRVRSAETSLKTSLKQEYPELASLVTVDTDSVESISGRLAKDEQLLEYYQQGDALYAFLLDRGGLKAYTLDSVGLTNLVSEYRRQISNEGQRHLALSQQLYKRLIAPLAADLKQPKLLIVAHGALHYLPFNALSDGQRYLIDRHSIRLLPSASVLRFLSRPKVGGNGELLVLGNPDVGDPGMDLPGAEAEARQLAKVWGGSQVLLRKLASETVVRNAGRDYSHLHFASHGQFDAEHPLNSRLLLAGDQFNDGSLTVGELYELRLNADMVTLSACETGLGKIASGDDVVGLTRGFLYAGASSIVASLWEVADDPTAYIMVEFYKNLKKMNKAEALRQAQIATRKKYPHPLYWAAFQLTGNAG